MLKISKLEKSYGDFRVLKGLDMTVNKGDIYGFLGKNGCGKSTTMNIVANIIPKNGGTVTFGKEDVKIGYLPESPAMFDYMNSYEYLEYIAACCKYEGDIKARINEVLTLTGMLEGGKRRIKGYSRGMNQRLGIAATIFDNPDLLILDEPTSALDPQGRAEVMKIISELSKTGTTIILCTHILSDVERVANRIGIVRNGVMAVEGSIDEIRRSYEEKSKKIIFTVFDNIKQAVNIVAGITNGNFAYDEKSMELVIPVLPEEKEEEKIKQLLNALMEKGITPSSFNLKKKTLEDIYIETIG